MKRRDFLKVTGAGLAGIPGILEARTTLSADPVALTRLTPNITTSRIGMGTGVHGWNRQSNLTRMERAKALDLIRYSYDRGIRFFDMADLYGTHGLVAEALADKPRESYALGTKIWCRERGLPEGEANIPTEKQVERFLKELKTDYIDLVQIHCMSSAKWQDEYRPHLDALENVKQKGWIRAHGVSCHTLAAARAAAESPWVDALHMRLNTEGLKMEGAWEDNVAVAERAQQNGKGVIIMKVLGEGTIKDASGRRKSTQAVARLSAVDVMIVGFEERSHVDEFLTNVADAAKA
ncbi:MAG: aldo/keto reductase [Planctomycetia bacterium]|nr:aldo/keto reductase [Planctomycetia bacterium]